jgi:uncharacterized membrane protein YphA (DoxX/SURF4 family)
MLQRMHRHGAWRRARPELQLLLVRVCVGLAFLPQAAPKLFAGVEARGALAQRLTALGIPHALQLVVIGGVVEFALGLMLMLGCGTRFAALAGALSLGAGAYLFTQPHALLWIPVCASFAIAGGGPWSVDAWLKSDFPDIGA